MSNAPDVRFPASEAAGKIAREAPFVGSSAPVLNNIQLLRGLAASVVVFRHLSQEGQLSMPISFGGFGVDIFFIVSGFIIAYVASYNSSHFVRRRIIRIVPFYWSATLGLFLIALILPFVLKSTQADMMLLLTSLFFIPHHGPNGVEPLLMLGWTLNFEMYFYLFFAAGLLVSRTYASVVAIGLIALTALLVKSFAPDDSVLQFYFANLILLEFVFGIFIYWIFRTYKIRAPRLLFRNAFIVVICLSFVALVLQEIYIGVFRWRGLTAGVPAAFLVISAIYLERDFGLRSGGRFLLNLGEASYILYLVHPYIIYSVLRLGFVGAEQFADVWKWLLIVGCLGLSMIIAIGLHLFFERPVMARLRYWFIPQKIDVVDRRHEA